MKKSFIQTYYDFFDKKIQDPTLVVWLIWIMIFLAWFLSNTNVNYKWNLFEFNNKIDNIIYIDWKKYKFVLQEIK